MSNYYHNPGGAYNAQYSNQYNEQEYYYDESNQQYNYQQQDSSQYYDEQQQPSQLLDQQYGQQPYQDQQYEQASYEPSSDTDSLFYACNPPLAVHNYGYDTQGDPISAVASSTAADTKLMYVASHTSGGSDRSRGARERRKSFRGSRMTLLYEDATIASGENRNIYSSFKAHPEAKSDVLNRLHSHLFGDGTVPSNANTYGAVHALKPRPPDAYGPPFGPPYLVSNSMYNPQFTRAEEKHCMGVSSILPAENDRVCTVSPHGVRIHARGGILVSDKEGMEGRTCGSSIGVHHVLAGGMPTGGSVGCNVHCMDLGRDLKVVSSHTLMADAGSVSKKTVTVADMAMNHARNTVVAGCTDGTIRLLDGERRMVEVAKAKAQRGGVAKVAVHDNLICATGYSSMGVVSPSAPVPYPFASPHVLIYDVRYLGRGGIPHMSNSRSGPRFASFLPRACIPGMDDNAEDPLLLVGSGQTFGGFELIAPFQTGAGSNYFQPELAPGESMTTVTFEDGVLTIGTSYGRVLQYGLTNYEKTTNSSKEKSSGFSATARTFNGGQGGSVYKSKELDMPPFIADPPALSIDPKILVGNDKGWNVFDSYVMAANPILSEEKMRLPSHFANEAVITSLGSMTTKVLVAPSKRWLSKKFIEKTPPSTDKYLLATYQNKVTNQESSSAQTVALPNPNKLLYSQLYSEFYDANADQAEAENAPEDDTEENEETGIPARYRALIRPPFYKMNSFNFALYNNTGLWVGWDYNPSWSNSWANPVLCLLYFVKEIRANALELQLNYDGAIPGQSMKNSVISELGLLFNLIDELPINCLTHPDGTVKPYVPSNFISSFTLLPEATNLALLDGVGESNLSRKPEALYRFLVQYIDKELGQLGRGNAIDSLQGIDFVSMVEFASDTKSTISSNHSLTLDLAYNQKWNNNSLDRPIRFSDILRFSLCKATPLRAFNEISRKYETVTQRKIATSLPSLLALSCCCAGAKDSGLQFWQNEKITSFLPEFIEIQIEEDKSISVVELTVDQDGNQEWVSSNRKLHSSFPSSLTKHISRAQTHPVKNTKKSYQLEAVISLVKSRAHDDYHVVHIRAPRDLAKQTLSRQLSKINECIMEKEKGDMEAQHLSLLAEIPLEELKSRRDQVQKKLDAKPNKDEWLLINGLKVTLTTSDDARSFCGFKEPSIILFREIPTEQAQTDKSEVIRVSDNVMDTVSLSNGCGPLCGSSGDLPCKGDLVAIDCEFVCVQTEKSQLSVTGAKNTISDSRNALARLSIIDCRTNKVIIDDYVLPSEPVKDCLTRFSGVREIDIDVNKSPHHLISTRDAYLKVRLLKERGCLFVGHGLNQDFRVLNISIPSNQIIDTAEIYHQRSQRYISLRYLTNYALGCDMQQEVHDSVEDARAAFDLYKKALRLKSEGKFDEYLVTLYAEGHKSQFKLMI